MEEDWTCCLLFCSEMERSAFYWILFKRLVFGGFSGGQRFTKFCGNKKKVNFFLVILTSKTGCFGQRGNHTLNLVIVWVSFHERVNHNILISFALWLDTRDSQNVIRPSHYYHHHIKGHQRSLQVIKVLQRPSLFLINMSHINESHKNESFQNKSHQNILFKKSLVKMSLLKMSLIKTSLIKMSLIKNESHQN